MNQMKITYREVNGYLIPNLKLPLEEASVRLGKWGRLHKDYLIKHKQSLLTILFSEGQLYSYLLPTLIGKHRKCGIKFLQTMLNVTMQILFFAIIGAGTEH